MLCVSVELGNTAFRGKDTSNLQQKKRTPSKGWSCAVWWWVGDQPINLVSERVSVADNVYVKTHTTVAPAGWMAFEVE